MYKLYNTYNKLIGYNNTGVNTINSRQLFEIDCNMIAIKLKTLGVLESDGYQYYSKVMQQYNMIKGLEIRDNIPYFKDTNVKWEYKPTSCKEKFKWCEAQSLDLCLLDTSNTADMNGMFYECEAQSIKIQAIDTSKAINMGSMFCKCDAQSLNLSSFDTRNVTDMQAMFRACKVQSLDLSSFDTSKVTNMKDMFCLYRAQYLDISSFDMSNVTNMSYMFFNSCIRHIKINREAFNKICNCQEAFDIYSESYKNFNEACEIV